MPGTYRVLAYTALGDMPSAPAYCAVVVVGGPVPPPPGPFPPPVPPGPIPPPVPPPLPPAPTDPMAPALLAAWAGETDPNRHQQAKLLAGLYRQGATIANDPKLATAKDLLGVMQQARMALMPDTALLRLRTAIGQELLKVLPTDPAAPMDAQTRANAANIFARVALIVEALQ
jgi:hypothetical protein